MNSSALRKIGQRIATQRHKNGMTQSELAVSSGLTLKTISMLELGQRELKVDSLIKLCKSLKVSADYLLFGFSLDADSQYMKEKLSKLDPDITQSIKSLLDALDKQ